MHTVHRDHLEFRKWALIHQKLDRKPNQKEKLESKECVSAQALANENSSFIKYVKNNFRRPNMQRILQLVDSLSLIVNVGYNYKNKIRCNIFK